MGYYVTIKESTFKIPAENLDTAYAAMCQLNFKVPNAQKGGGSWPGKDKAPQFGPNESCWFSWMEWNYHETCKNAEEILQALGFDTSIDSEGNLCIDWYDSKTGQEDLFLAAISPLAQGHIIWEGEDGDTWGETYGGRWVVTKHRGAPDYSDLISDSPTQSVAVHVVEDGAIVGTTTAGLLPKGTV